MTQIRAILFDADGVLQRASPGRREAWQRLIGPAGDVDAFFASVSTIERPALEGRTDFVGAFEGLLKAWPAPGAIADALAAWTMIEPDGEVVQLVQALRQAGTPCCLASNQEPYRASHMSDTLDYRGLFDREFYSCRVGLAKPAPDYFAYIADVLGVAPANLLFFDDHEINVTAARAVGLEAVRFHLDSGAAALVGELARYGVRLS